MIAVRLILLPSGEHRTGPRSQFRSAQGKNVDRTPRHSICGIPAAVTEQHSAEPSPDKNGRNDSLRWREPQTKSSSRRSHTAKIEEGLDEIRQGTMVGE